MPLSFFRKIAIPSNISTYLSRTLIIITVVTTLLIGGVFVVSQTIQFNKLSNQKSKEYIEDQKIYIKEIVENELEYIRIQNEIFRQNINDKIRQNVNQAINTAEAIYQKYAGVKSDEEIKALIVATISSLKFEMKYEEVFIATLDGTGVYYPRKPEFAGKDMRKFTDANGSSVILEEIKLMKTAEEGFLDYNVLSKPTSESSPHKKITFVRKLGHFNWYFGSKQYIDDYFPKFKYEIAQKISSVRFRNGGYVFMNHTNGTPIVMDGKIYHGELNLLKSADTARRNVFMKELELVQTSSDGGYFYYKWNKINESAPSEKCAYVEIFKEYNWIVGAGFYIDDINQSIKAQQAALRYDQKKNILIILLILTILLFSSALIIYHFNKRYNSDFARFFNFFLLSQNSFNKLNISELYFDEFKQAGIAANKMIVQRKETEERLIEEQKKATESDRLKSAFLANMSHEIRTPMNAILGFSELLEDKTQDEVDRIVFIQLIRKNGAILLSLINDIIDISKIEANLLTVRKRLFRLDLFLTEIDHHYIEFLSTKKDKNIQFSIQNSVNPEEFILTDESRLRQILDNLIGNSIKFTASGTIVLDVKMIDKSVHFSVTDTGIGIPHDQQTTIFERFMQVEHGIKMNFGGTGLGLAISKNLIELLGGTIHLESEPGIGSNFYFHIKAD